jgi:hypothetical protein
MERGTPTRPRTFNLPGQNDTPLEFTQGNTKEFVSAMISFSTEIVWTFAKDTADALNKFNTVHDDGHVEYFIFRIADSQLEIPCRGKPGNLYIRAAATVPVQALGLSISFIEGGERR